VTTTSVFFDKPEQLAAIQSLVLPGERLFAVYDCKGAGTGFVGITNKRLIFYDKAFLGRRKAMTSVPFSKLTSVSAVDEGGLIQKTSELVVKAGSETHEFEFRGADKAIEAYKYIMGELLQGELE
jgi:hypothetical protein